MPKKLTLILAALLAVAVVLVAGCARTTPPAVAATTAPAAPAISPSPAPSQESSPPPAAVPASAPVSTAPAPVNGPDTAKIADILTSPKAYSGKVVVVQGKIVSECGSGCWFTLQDGKAVLYVDLAPNNMVIPQKKGSIATVKGEIVAQGSDVYMVGSKVDF